MEYQIKLNSTKQQHLHIILFYQISGVHIYIDMKPLMPLVLIDQYITLPLLQIIYAYMSSIASFQSRLFGGGMQIARFNSYALLFLKVEKISILNYTFLRKPTISGIHYMKMKSNDLLKLMILIFVFILTYLFFHRSILFYQKRSHLIQGIMW